MNRHRRLGILGLVISLLCGASPALAQDASAPSGEYSRDLGRIIGRIRGVQWTADLCAERYPETASANQAAVDAWQRKYEPFLSEMTKKFDAMPAYWAAHDASGRYSESTIKSMLEQMMSQGRDQLKKQYRVDQEPEKFQELCKRYPLALQSATFDVERFYPNEVAVVRRGP